MQAMDYVHRLRQHIGHEVAWAKRRSSRMMMRITHMPSNTTQATATKACQLTQKNRCVARPRQSAKLGVLIAVVPQADEAALAVAVIGVVVGG